MGKTFPGFQTCLQMMRKPDAQTAEDGFHLLLGQAGNYVEELVDELNRETDEHLQYWLLELLAETREPHLLPLFVKHLYGPCESLRNGAILGLRQLDTQGARQALWETSTSV